MRRDMVFLSLLFIVLQAAPIVSCVYVEIDDIAIVYKVVDGDTFDAFPVGRIRLADIDAPDTFDPGYDDAKSYLSQLVNGKHVYVDVDDDNKMDVYNRLVCVVYVRENSTHLKNVNKAMLESGHASVDNHANEFNPSSWTLFTYYPTTDLPEKTYKELLSAYVELDYDYSDLQQDYSSLETAHSQLQSQYDNLQTTYDDLKSTNRDLMEENYVLSRDYAELESRYNELNSSYYEKIQIARYDELKAEYDELRTDYENLQEDYGDLEDNNSQLRNEHNQLRNVHAMLLTEHDSLASSHYELSLVHNETVSEYEVLQSNYTKLAQDYINAKNECSLLQTDFEMLSNELNTYRPTTYTLAIAAPVLVTVTFLLTKRLVKP